MGGSNELGNIRIRLGCHHYRRHHQLGPLPWMVRMRLALIPPISMIDQTFATDYQLMLPHLIHDAKYSDAFFKHSDNPGTFVILDNGVAEGELIDFGHIMAVAKGYSVDEVVLPDVLLNARATQSHSHHMHDLYLNAGIDFMFVAQGETEEEVKDSVMYAADHLDKVTTIGIPRHLISTLYMPFARWRIVDWMVREKLNERFAIHLLGMNGEAPYEMYMNTSRLKTYVRGFDTSAPYNFAYARLLMENGGIASRPLDYFGKFVNEFDMYALHRNLGYMFGGLV